MKKLYDSIGKEMFMYLFFGVVTTIINLIVYYIFNIWLGVNVGISTTIAFICSVIFAYITNKLYVFESKTKTVKEVVNEMIKFFSARIFTYFVDLFLMILFVDKLNFNSLLCKILVNGLVIIINYLLSKLIVFKKSK